ncbi:SpaH/EbpB family LPXTG-anchored major pilin [Gordonibacter pamelaeae]
MCANLRAAAAAATLAVVLALCATALAGAGSPALADADASAARTGSIVVHEYRSQLGGTNPGNGDDDPVLPEDALPLADVPLTLYQLSADPEAANGFEPAVDVDSPPLASFDPRSGTTDAQGVLAFRDLPRGVYLLVQGDVAGVQPAQRKLLVAVPMQDAAGGDARWDVHVYPKSSAAASIAKAADDPDAVYGVGDEARWRITVPVPAELKLVAADGSVRYGRDLQVRDFLDARLDDVPGAQVSLVDATGQPSATALVPGTDYEETYDEQGRTVSWAFTDEALRRIVDAGAANLVITVATRVNEAAYDGPGAIFNNAAVSFTAASGAPTGAEVMPGGVPDPANPAHPRIRTGGVLIDKRLEETGEKLPGAAFKVARSRADALAGRFIARTVDGAQHDVQLVTDADGAAALGGLGAGTYWLMETQAPSCADAEGRQRACVRLAEPAAVDIPADPKAAEVRVTVANRLETPLDWAGSAVGGALAKTGDAGWLVAAALAAVVLAGTGMARRLQRRGGRTDDR